MTRAKYVGSPLTYLAILRYIGYNRDIRPRHQDKNILPVTFGVALTQIISLVRPLPLNFRTRFTLDTS